MPRHFFQLRIPSILRNRALRVSHSTRHAVVHLRQTIILLEALDDSMQARKGGRDTALTKAEAVRVKTILSEAMPGLRVAKSIPELLDLIDKHCVRATDDAGIAEPLSGGPDTVPLE